MKVEDRELNNRPTCKNCSCLCAPL